jgi:hypothetical protein
VSQDLSHEPDADELKLRVRLIELVDGPDAVPPKPTARPRDWLDNIIETDLAPAEKEAVEPDAAPVPAAPRKVKKPRRPKTHKRPRKLKPAAARTAWDTRPPSPRQSLAEAWDRVPYRLRWLTYHATAAYLGWSVGLVDWATYVTAWISDTGLVGPQAVFWYGAAGATLLLYRRTRSWWWPVAWLAAVPATSTVVGVLLYAPHP